ncbi:ankyrin repeat domain-containing protein [Actinomadura sp. DC4]|uniref:ankyrin repeat domain-containing protein n=1 Tax=Actinomadura sp. DC4 TaxID=3055069 RepID=UPI0025B005AA|nr:ankyrin repeat domain-containing protein [Actinomadura sp. DC4]MDN3351238.1 ankyrin repeat domain-containing protein [Actinomadura sp. DC4]
MPPLALRLLERDGLTDALRLSAGMTAKCAVAGLADGGGKTVVALPEGLELTAPLRRAVLDDVGDVIASLDGLYAAGPDVGTSPADMAVIGARTSHVFCRPEAEGGSGDSSPHTAVGTLAALRAVGRRLWGTPDLRDRRVAVVGLGSVGARIARLLPRSGTVLTLSDIDPAKRALTTTLGATWSPPDEALTAEADIVIPSALGGVLIERAVPLLRCAAIAGPANNQLATPSVAALLHDRDIAWVPDYVVSAGGVIHALTVELHHGTAEDALARVRAIEDTVFDLLTAGTVPALAADELTRHRLTNATREAGNRRRTFAAAVTTLRPPTTYSAHSPDLADNPSVEEVAEQLGHAVYHNDVVTVRRLLAAGTDPNGVDEFDIPFMDTAVTRGSVDALRVLVAYGGRLDGAASGGSPLLYHVVAGCDLPAMLPVFLELGAEVQQPLNSHGWTALHVAAAYGYARSARLLLDTGADPAARTSDGLTPAEMARANGQHDLAEILGVS